MFIVTLFVFSLVACGGRAETEESSVEEEAVVEEAPAAEEESMVATMLIPFEARIVPLFFVMQDLNLDNTVPAIFLPSVADAYIIFLLRQHFKELPDDLYDANPAPIYPPAAPLHLRHDFVGHQTVELLRLDIRF